MQLGGTVDESITKLGELNAIIKELKSVKKAEEKAVKDAAKAEEKAKKAEEKAAKKAAKAASKSPSFPKDDWRTAMFPNEKLGKMDEWSEERQNSSADCHSQGRRDCQEEGSRKLD